MEVAVMGDMNATHHQSVFSHARQPSPAGSPRVHRHVLANLFF